MLSLTRTLISPCYGRELSGIISTGIPITTSLKGNLSAKRDLTHQRITDGRETKSAMSITLVMCLNPVSEVTSAKAANLGKPICIRCTEVPAKAIPEVRWISMRGRRTE